METQTDLHKHLYTEEVELSFSETDIENGELENYYLKDVHRPLSQYDLGEIPPGHIVLYLIHWPDGREEYFLEFEALQNRLNKNL